MSVRRLLGSFTPPFAVLALASGALAAGAFGWSPSTVLAQTSLPATLQEDAPVAWLGVKYDFRREFTFGSDQRPRTEVRISAVYRDGPAFTAGLRPGDLVERINGMRPSEALVMELSPAMRAGDSLLIAVRRGDQAIEQWVVADVRPASEASQPTQVRFFSREMSEARQVRRGSATAGAGEGFTIVWQGSDGGQPSTYRFRVSESEDLPFEAFVIRTPQTDSLMALIRNIRNQIGSSALRRPRPSPPGADRSSLERVELASRLDELQHELATVSRERLQLSGRSQGIGDIRVRVSPGPALSPLVQNRRQFLMGAEVVSIGEEVGEYFGVGAGVLVSQVGTGTPAHSVGLRAGDVIVGAGDDNVTSFDDLRRLLQARSDLVLTLVRNGQRRTVALLGGPR